MKLFPPSPSDTSAATRFVKSLPRRDGVSDYQAIREAGTGSFGVSIMFIAMACIQADKIEMWSLAICLVAFLFGVFLAIVSVRTLALLDLFPHSNLPEVPADSPSETNTNQDEQGEDTKPDNVTS